MIRIQLTDGYFEILFSVVERTTRKGKKVNDTICYLTRVDGNGHELERQMATAKLNSMDKYNRVTGEKLALIRCLEKHTLTAYIYRNDEFGNKVKEDSAYNKDIKEFRLAIWAEYERHNPAHVEQLLETLNFLQVLKDKLEHSRRSHLMNLYQVHRIGEPPMCYADFEPYQVYTTNTKSIYNMSKEQLVDAAITAAKNSLGRSFPLHQGVSHDKKKS